MRDTLTGVSAYDQPLAALGAYRELEVDLLYT